MNSIGKRPRRSVPRRSEVRRRPAKPIGPWLDGMASRAGQIELRNGFRKASMTISRFDRTVPGLVQKALSGRPHTTAGDKRSSPSLSGQVLARASGKTQQEIAAACKGACPNHEALRHAVDGDGATPAI